MSKTKTPKVHRGQPKTPRNPLVPLVHKGGPNRPTKHQPAKGPGSYRRKPKHPDQA